MVMNDPLKMYRGAPYIINDTITITQPTLGEICDFGEHTYFSFLNALTATPTDMKYQLSLAGIDWNEISDYELFLLSYSTFDLSRSCLLFGGLDFTVYMRCMNKESGQPCLYNEDADSTIDASVYELIVSHLRKVHHMKKHEERAMTETTRKVLLDEAREQYESEKNTGDNSFLKQLISTMINMPGFHYNHETVWNMKIHAFMDSVSKIQHIKNADLLLQSGYSGFGIDLSKLNNKSKVLNYFAGTDD